MRLFVAAAATCCLCAGQTAGPAFEVASIRRLTADAGGPGSNLMRGGPGTSDPGRISFAAVSMRRLLMAAYRMEADQIAGPGWLDTERYAVAATLPPGATRDGVAAMLRNLIDARFQLRAHRETRSSVAYALETAKGGAKLSDGPLRIPSGYPEAAPGAYATLRTESGLTRLTFRQCGIATLIRALGLPLSTLAGNRLVTPDIADRSGLSGAFDFTLEFAGFLGPGGASPTTSADSSQATTPDLFSALQAQLGLRLVEVKTTREMLIIDALDRTPAEN